MQQQKQNDENNLKQKMENLQDKHKEEVTDTVLLLLTQKKKY